MVSVSAMPVSEAIPIMFPQHMCKWDRWVGMLKGFEIDNVWDVCIITEELWAEIKLPPVLKSGLSYLRGTSLEAVVEAKSAPPPAPVVITSPSSPVASTPSPKVVVTPASPQSASAGSTPVASSRALLDETSDAGSAEEVGLTAADFSSSESDEDTGRIKKMIAKPSNGHAFPIVKGNKYGVKQNRVIVIDEQSATLKFCDTSFKMKSEVPFAHVLVNGVEGNDKKISITFRQRNRVYDVTFVDAKSCTLFRNNYDTAVFVNSRNQSIHRTVSVLPSDNNTLAENEVVELSNHQEYRVIKKNKFRNRQQRILVLKPKSLLLLDHQRKFIKAFPYDQIHSVEIMSADDKKKDASSEMETFLVFQKATAQRPFQIFFPDSFDRNHFIQSLKSVHRKLILKDEEDVRHRFVVTKLAVNIAQGVRQGTARILEVLPSESVIRSYDRIKQFKDTPFAKITQIEPCVSDNRRIFLTTNKKFIFDFADQLSRARFLALTTYLLDSVHEKTPGKKISIFAGTWNVAKSPAVDIDLSQYVPSNAHDLYAIAMQECPHSQRDAWVVEFQRQIGGFPKEYSYLPEKERDEQSNYEIVGSAKLWEIALLVFARKDLAYKVTCREAATVACGVGDVLGNKGGAGVFFRYEDTTLCFVSCHLAAHSDRVKERRQDFLKITKLLRFGDRDVDLLMQCDHVIWFGDLNYRVEKGFHLAVAASEHKRFDELTQADQLRKEMNNKKASEVCFAEFHEGPITFAPTYRWEKASNVFSNKNEQAPSYTDRVLWHSLQTGQLTQDSYASSPDTFGSDHRPVFATFTMIPRSFRWGNYTEIGDSRLDVLLTDVVLDSQDLEAQAEFQLVVSAPFLLEDFASHFVKIGDFLDGWKWPELVFRAFVQPSHLSGFRLLVAIRSFPFEASIRESIAHAAPQQHGSKPETIAFCSIPLTLGSSKFQATVSKDGLVLGKLSGKLSYVSTMEDAPVKQQKHAPPPPSRQSTRSALHD